MDGNPNQNPGTALSIAESTDLTRYFREGNAVDSLIAQIEAEARAHVPDLTTAKGREAIKSLAFKVSRSKTALDAAGKQLNEAARTQIDAVDAQRRLIRDRLDALRDEVRRPLEDWEAAEALRQQHLRERLAALDAGRADAGCESWVIAAVLAEVEAVEVGADWAEYQDVALAAKGKAVAELRRNLEIATQREADAAELLRLRRQEAARLEAERQRAAAEEAERQRLEQERAAAEEAAQRERDRLAAERREAEEAQRRRDESARIRSRVRRDIEAAIAALPHPLTPEAVAEALISGVIPNTQVRF